MARRIGNPWRCATLDPPARDGGSMADLETPGEVIAHAREARGWSYFEAARRSGCGDQQIKNLESGKTEPAEVKARTLVGIIRAFWPDIRLCELIEEPLLELTPASPEATALLISQGTSKVLTRRIRALAREVADLA